MIIQLFLLQIHEAAAADPAENPIAHMTRQFGVDWPKLIAQIIVFLIIGFCLKKFAFEPIQKVLEERRTRIADALANADKIKLELAQAEATRREILQKANDQATAMVSDAQKAASVQGEKRLQEAIAQAEGVLTKAREATALEREKMLNDLRREVAGLVIDTTTKVSGKVLTADDQKRLSDETAMQLRS